MFSLPSHFAEIADQRVERCKLYPLSEILLITLCAVICGAERWEDIADWWEAPQDWLRTHLGLDLVYGIPTDDTFRRVLSRLDPDAFQGCFLKWMEGVQTRT